MSDLRIAIHEQSRMTRTAVFFAFAGIVFFAGVFVTPQLAAQCPPGSTMSLAHTIRNPTPESFDNFGNQIAISGNYALVGDSGDSTGASKAGSAYLFDVVSGALLQTFNNPTPNADDRFGSSVAISGNNVLVGSPFDDTIASNCGNAYLFDAVSGALIRVVSNPAPTSNDYYGLKVALSENYALVGAPYDDMGATQAGSAYLFDVVSGSLLQTFHNPTPSLEEYFSDSMAISGNNVLIGTPDDDTGASSSGIAYLFDAITGALLETFNNPTPASPDHFGDSVAISGNLVVIGAPDDDTGANASGSAYLFDALSGALLKTLNNPTPDISDNFGNSVSLSGNIVLVAARDDNAGATESGSVYLFDASSGALLQTVNNPEPTNYDSFGNSAAISGNIIGVGASGAESAYIYFCQTPTPSPTHSPSPTVSPTPTASPTSTPLPPCLPLILRSTLAKSTPAALDQFGYSVAISGDKIVVGAYGADTTATDGTPQTDYGSAYIYSATTGSYIT